MLRFGTMHAVTETLHANLFFFITALGVVVFFVLLSIALVILIRVLRAIHRIVSRVDAGSETIAQDLARVREFARPRQMAELLRVFLGGRRRRTRRRSRQDDD